MGKSFYNTLRQTFPTYNTDFRFGTKQILILFVVITTIIFEDSDNKPLTCFKSIPCSAAEVTRALRWKICLSNADVNSC